MKNSVKNEVKRIIEEEKLNCSIKEFEDKVDWDRISIFQKLSGNFIREYNSLTKAKGMLGVKSNSISHVLTGGQKTAHKYFWKYSK